MATLTRRCSIRSAILALLAVVAPGSSAPAQPAPFGESPDWFSKPAFITEGVALGDVDGDGDLDLVCAVYSESNTVYLAERRTISATPDWSSDPAYGSRAAALGDIDGDGDLDLVCANDGDPNTLYLNEGGTLSTIPAWSSGPSNRTQSVALGDVDGDGDLDLVFGNGAFGLFQSNTLYLNESGTFPADPDWSSAVSNRTWSVALGDVDGDGNLELACGNGAWGDAEANTLYHNEGGAFSPAPVWTSTLSTHTLGVALGDVDGDGDLDLVCGNDSENDTMYRNDGGTLTTTPAWSYGTADRTQGLALGDVDADGDLDLVFGDYWGSTSLSRNDGGSLSTTPSWSSVTSARVKSVALGDLDGDGLLDLACGSSSWSDAVYFNVGATVSATPAWVAAASNRTQSVAVGDVDGDGDLDLVCGNGFVNERHPNTLYLNEGGSFSTTPAWTSGPSNGTRAVALGDIDGDGDLDLVCGNEATRNTMYRNEKGTFSTTPTWFSDLSNRTHGVALGDIDGDGDLDLVCGNYSFLEKNALYLNEGGMLSTTPAWEPENSDLTLSVALGDVDGDGDLDLFCGNRSTRKNTLYLNEEGTLSTLPAWSSGPTNETRTVALGDVDGDGDLDLVCGNISQRANLYLNEGGSLSTNSVWSPGASSETRAVAFADVDRDGDLDLVCGRNPQPNVLFLNEGGTLATTPAWSSDPVNSTNALAVSDIDRDGDVDLVCGNYDESNALYLGRGNPAFKGDPVLPTNHLPNNAAHLRQVSLSQRSPNLRTVHLLTVDVESDPVWVQPEYQYEGVPTWFAADVEGAERVGPLSSSPSGTEHEFDWDISRIRFDDRTVHLRLRTVSHSSRVGLTLHTPSYQHRVGRVTPNRPSIVSSDSLLAFGTVTLGDSVSLGLQISNEGNQDLALYDVTLPTPELSLDMSLPLEIPPGASLALTLTMAPRTELLVSGNVTLFSNDPVNGAFDLRVETDIRDLVVETRPLAAADSIPLGEAFTVLIDPADRVVVERGALFHRPAIPGAVWASVELARSGSSLIGVIPGRAVTEVGLEYYVEVENSGVFRTDPPGAPHDASFFQAVAPPTLVTAVPRPNVVGTFPHFRRIPVAAIVQEGATVVSGRVYYRMGGEVDYRVAPLDLGAPDPEATIPGEYVHSRGVQFWLEVETEQIRLTDPAIDPVERPIEIPITVPFLFESHTQSPAGYRMMSVPLDLSSEVFVFLEDFLSDEPAFGPYDPTRWRAFRFLPWRGYVEVAPDMAVSDRDFLHTTPGRGFWLTSRQADHFDTTPLVGISVSSSEPYEIVLDRGWNQIGHPFDYAVALEAVCRSSTEIGEPVVFDPGAGTSGAYLDDPPASLLPFHGYFILNEAAARETLWVPPVQAAEVTVRAPFFADRWSQRIEASTDAGATGIVTVGTDSRASDHLDEFDRPKPPSPPPPWLDLAIENRDWRHRSGPYRRDLRSAGADGHRWNVEVRAENPGDRVTLTGAISGDHPPASIRLLDLEQNTSVSFLEATRHELIAFGADTPYRLALVAGTESFVASQGELLIESPVSLSLDRNAPNPFRSATRIRFGLPRPSRVSLAVYNLQGRRVAALVDHQSLPAGYHIEIWDGRDGEGRRVASGVYFYRLQTDAGGLSERMVLLR